MVSATGGYDVVYKAELDESEVLASLNRIDANLNKIATQGAKAFSQVENSSKQAGVSIKATSIATGLLTAEMIRLGKEGVRALAEIIGMSIDLAREQERLGIIFTNVFKGNEKVATAFMDIVSNRAIELGLNIQESLALVSTFTPSLKGLEKPTEAAKLLLEVSSQLTKVDPAQGIKGASIALRELLSGDTRSLVRRFELGTAQIDIIKQYQKEYGEVEGAIKGLNVALNEMGFNLESLSGTIQVSLGKLENFRNLLLIAAGEGLRDNLTVALKDLVDFLYENQDVILVFGKSVGGLVNAIAESTLGEFIDYITSIDPSVIEDLSTSFQTLTNAIQEGQDADFTFVGKLIEGFSDLVKILAVATEVFNKLNESEDAGANVLNTLVPPLLLLKDGVLALLNPLVGLLNAFSLLDESLKIDTGFDTGEWLDQLNQSLGVYEDASIKAKKATDDLNVSEEEIDETLKATNTAVAEQSEEYAKLVEVLEKSKDKQRNEERRHNREMDDIMRDFARKQIDFEREASEKREDLITKNNRRLEDIERKHDDKIADFRTKTERDAAKTAREHARERVQIDKDSNQQRIDLEKDFRNQLQQIELDYRYAIEDAIEEQDAIAYVQAIKDRERAIEEANLKRMQKDEEIAADKEQTLAALKDKQAIERQEFEIANQQKLEDLQLELQRELEENAIKLQREEEDLQLSLDRKRAKINEDLERRIEDENINHKRRLADIQAALHQELEEFTNISKLIADEQIRQSQRATEKTLNDIETVRQAFRAMGIDATRAAEQSNRATNLRGENYYGAGGAPYHDVTSTPIPSGNSLGLTYGDLLAGAITGLTAGVIPGNLVTSALSGFQTGGSVVVPRGYENDNYPIGGGAGASTGELLSVFPSRMMSSFIGNGGGGTNNNISNTATVNVDPGMLSPQQLFQTRQTFLQMFEELSQ